MSDEVQNAAAEKLDEKAEQLRREAERLGNEVEEMNRAMGATFMKTALYTLVGSLMFLPVAILGAYVGFRLAVKKTAKENLPRTLQRSLGL